MNEKLIENEENLVNLYYNMQNILIGINSYKIK